MTSTDEKARRKALARGAAERGRAEAVAAMPIALSHLHALFDHLDAALEHGCDHSLRLTRAFLLARGLPEAGTVPWLLGQGGGCDCEVLANVEEAWGGQA